MHVCIYIYVCIIHSYLTYVYIFTSCTSVQLPPHFRYSQLIFENDTFYHHKCFLTLFLTYLISLFTYEHMMSLSSVKIYIFDFYFGLI